MLESGIGRAQNIAMSTLPGFTRCQAMFPPACYWDEDIIGAEVEVSPRGTIRLSQAPGRGYEIKRDLIDKVTIRKDSWKTEMVAQS